METEEDLNDINFAFPNREDESDGYSDEREDHPEDSSIESSSLMSRDTSETVIATDQNSKDENEILEKVREAVMKIKDYTTQPVKVTLPLHYLSRLIYDNKWKRYQTKIGDHLREIGFAKDTVNMIDLMDKKGFYPTGVWNTLSNPQMFKTNRHILTTAWNFSAVSESFAVDLADSNLLPILNSTLVKFQDTCTKVKSDTFIARASLSIMRNLALRPGNKQKFISAGSFQYISRYVDMDNEIIQLLALTTMALIATEDQTHELIGHGPTLDKLIHLISISVNKDDINRIREGFTPHHLTTCLSHLADNTANVQPIVDKGALKPLCRLLYEADYRKRESAAVCLSRISFSKYGRKNIKEYSKLFDKITLMATEETNERIKSTIEMIHFHLDIKSTVDVPPTTTVSTSKHHQSSDPHIFISFNDRDREVVIKIIKKLELANFNIVFDPKTMGSSLLTGISNAVENASVVIICVSECFKQDVHCRFHVNYAFDKKKEFIPLRVQTKFKPEGWLAVASAGKSIIDFCGQNRQEFEESIKMVIAELNLRTGSVTDTSIGAHGNTTGSNYFVSSDDDLYPPSISEHREKSEENEIYKSEQTVHHPQVVRISETKIPEKLSNMSNNDVKKWLIENELASCTAKLQTLDGKMLWQLKLQKLIPGMTLYHDALTNHFNLGVMEVLKFGAALDDLVA